MAKRDTSRDGFRNRVETFVLTHFKPVWLWLNRSRRLGDFVNGKIIDVAVKKTKARPFQYSTFTDYTSWRSLTDRTWSGRHLPQKSQDGLPDLADVTQLFQRKPGGAGRLSTKSTLLFASFAQWFTDGFLMTDSADRRKTYSKSSDRRESALRPQPRRNSAASLLLAGKRQERPLEVGIHRRRRIRAPAD